MTLIPDILCMSPIIECVTYCLFFHFAKRTVVFLINCIDVVFYFGKSRSLVFHTGILLVGICIDLAQKCVDVFPLKIRKFFSK